MNTETIQARLEEIKDGELRLCPFCGGKAVVDTIDPAGGSSAGYGASCQAEGTGCAGVIFTPNEFYGIYDEAVTAWNNRPIEDELIALVESLLKEKGEIRRETTKACIKFVSELRSEEPS